MVLAVVMLAAVLLAVVLLAAVIPAAVARAVTNRRSLRLIGGDDKGEDLLGVAKVLAVEARLPPVRRAG